MTEQPDGTIPEFDLADRMRKALRESGTGVAEMAAYLDVTRHSVSNWISGRRPPSTQTLRLWALRTGVSYDWLRTGRFGAPAPVYAGFAGPRKPERCPP